MGVASVCPRDFAHDRQAEAGAGSICRVWSAEIEVERLGRLEPTDAHTLLALNQ